MYHFFATLSGNNCGETVAKNHKTLVQGIVSPDWNFSGLNLKKRRDSVMAYLAITWQMRSVFTGDS